MTSITSGYANADGLSVYYEIHGGDPAAATPFVLLAGGVVAIETGYKGGLLRRLAALRPVIAIVGRGFSEDEFRGISAPTLIVIGDNDFTRADHAVEMRNLIPGARLAVLPGTAHMDSIDRVDWLVPMIAENLARAQ